MAGPESCSKSGKPFNCKPKSLFFSILKVDPRKRKSANNDYHSKVFSLIVIGVLFSLLLFKCFKEKKTLRNKNYSYNLQKNSVPFTKRKKNRKKH